MNTDISKALAPDATISHWARILRIHSMLLNRLQVKNSRLPYKGLCQSGRFLMVMIVPDVSPDQKRCHRKSRASGQTKNHGVSILATQGSVLTISSDSKSSDSAIPELKHEREIFLIAYPSQFTNDSN